MIILDKEIERVDKLYWSPKERAQGVFTIITEHFEELKKSGVTGGDIPTMWDILCFAVEYVGMQSITIGDENLTDIAVELTNWLRSAHYSEPEKLYGKPDKISD